MTGLLPNHSQARHGHPPEPFHSLMGTNIITAKSHTSGTQSHCRPFRLWGSSSVKIPAGRSGVSPVRVKVRLCRHDALRWQLACLCMLGEGAPCVAVMSATSAAYQRTRSRPLAPAAPPRQRAMSPPTRYASMFGSVPPTEIMRVGTDRHLLGNVDHALWPSWLKENRVPSLACVSSALAPYMCATCVDRGRNSWPAGNVVVFVLAFVCFSSVFASLAGVIQACHIAGVCEDLSHTSPGIWRPRFSGGLHAREPPIRPCVSQIVTTIGAQPHVATTAGKVEKHATRNNPSRDTGEGPECRACVGWPRFLVSGVVGGDLPGFYEWHQSDSTGLAVRRHGEVVVRQDGHRPHRLLLGTPVPRW